METTLIGAERVSGRPGRVSQADNKEELMQHVQIQG